MRTLHVIDDLGPAGAERSLAELMPFLLRSGMSPTIVCSTRLRAGVHDDVERAGVPVRVLAAGDMLRQAIELRRIVLELRPDLLHTSLFKSDVIGRLAAAGTGVPVLTSLVNTTYDKVRRSDPNLRPGRLRAVQVIDGFTARHLTTWFHAITYAVRDASVMSLGIPCDRVTVVERGRDRSRLGVADAARRARTRAALGIADDQEVLLNVGRQEFQKGQRVLLEAVNRVLRERPHAVLLIAGRPGNATAELQRVLSGCSERARIQFLDNRDDVPDLMCAADLLIFPSLYEGLGGSVIEAMALGLPVVVSRIPALIEVVEEGGNAELVAPNAPAPLATVISQLLADAPRRAAYARRGREIFEQRFTLERAAERMVGLFQFVAGLRAAPRSARAAAATRPVSRRVPTP